MARAFAAAVAVLALAAAPAHAASCVRPQSWVAGSVSLCRGTLVYTDYVYDDHGADTGAVLTDRIGNLSPTGGDQKYPKGQESTADIVRLTLRPRRGRLLVSARLNALYRPRETVLAVAIDTDNKSSTGGGRWGKLDVSSKGWDKLAMFTRGDTKTNTISGRMRMPKGRRWRVQAVAAIAESGQVMNVAFRGTREHALFWENTGAALSESGAGAWFEDNQAKALKDGDISAFGTTVNVRSLTRRRTRAAALEPGLHERVYVSRYCLKPCEGISEEGIPGRGDGGGEQKLGFEQKFNFPGRFMPYGVYVPKKPGPHGMQMVFHGSGANLSSLVAASGMQQRFGEDLNRVIVVPEARGTEGWGSDISERDLLDVMADVERTYGIDKKREFAGGYSQGGYLTYRTASLHPDRFAGAVDWVGFTGDGANGSPPGPTFHYTAGAVGNAPDFIKNLLNVPTVMLYAGADELVQVWTGLAMDDAFKATDNAFRFYEHPSAEHLTLGAADDWRKEAAYVKDLKLVENPTRVVFTTAEFLDSPAFGIRHDHAYWVSEIRGRGKATDYATVDLTTSACGGTKPVLERTSGTGDDPVPWTSDDQHVTATTPLPAAPTLSGTLTNLRSATLDAGRTCLRGKSFAYDIESDGPATISLSDGRKIALPASGHAVGTLPG